MYHVLQYCTTPTYNIHTCHEQARNESHSDVLQPRDVHDTPAEARRDRGEAALLDLGEKHLVLIRELLVVLADLANDAVRADAVRALGVVLAQTAVRCI